MNYEALKTRLAKYNQEEVNVFIQYLKNLETEKDKQGKLKNAWFRYFTEEQAYNLYSKVALDELYIDGQTITLQFAYGSVNANYNYQAYKNKLLKIYPETLFDIQNVFQGDTFSFKKASGKVLYNHSINNPFSDNKVIIGCYCIIKNKRGEFIETLNNTEIQKMRNIAKTQTIWNTWETEMTLKSVIKRACKRHFNDVVVNIEKIDNENYELENVSLESEVQSKIQECTEIDELGVIYDEYKDKVSDEPAFLSMLTAKKLELKKAEADENS